MTAEDSCTMQLMSSLLISEARRDDSWDANEKSPRDSGACQVSARAASENSE